MTKKREVETSTIIFVAAAAAAVTFFASWVHYSGSLDRMKESCDMKVSIYRSNAETLFDRNRALEDKLTRVKALSDSIPQIKNILGD